MDMQNRVSILILLLLIIIGCEKNDVRLKQKIFTFEYGEKIPQNSNYYLDSDNRSLNVIFDFNTQENSFLSVGKYKAYIRDKKKMLHFEIEVKDSVSPVFISFSDEVILDISSNLHDLIKHFHAVDYVGDQSEQVIVWINGYIDFEKTGSYLVNVYAKDKNKNQIVRKCNVKIVDEVKNLDIYEIHNQNDNQNTTNGENIPIIMDSQPIQKENEESITEKVKYELPKNYIDENCVHYEYFYLETDAQRRFNELKDARYHKCYFDDYETEYYEVIWFE